MKTILLVFFTFGISFLSDGQASKLVISQVYFLNNNPNSPFGRKYIEVFNRGTLPENTRGYSIQTQENGSWHAFPLPDTIINAGQYFLIASSSYNSAHPDIIAPDYFIPDFNLVGNPGGVALSTVLIPFGACSWGTAIDRVLWSSPFTTGCPEGQFAFYPIDESSSKALFRNNNGCQDLNDNRNDFALGTANPRNSHSAINICGLGTAPLVSAGPDISNLVKVEGLPGISKYYSLSGYNLNPASGNITITPPQYFEISTDNINFSSLAIAVPYAAGHLAIMNIYIRLNSSAVSSGSTISGTITHSGGNNVNVNGNVIKEYYNSKANLGLQNTATWSSTADGTGPSPSNFTDAQQRFNIVDQANANYAGNWAVSGFNSVITLGDGINPIELNIPAGANAISATTTIDVLNNSTLNIFNNTLPKLRSIMPGSTINFAQAGTTTADTIRIPLHTYYNLKLTNGIKLLAGDSLHSSGSLYVHTIIENNFIVDGVVCFNGEDRRFYPTAYVTNLICNGDVTFLNGTTFQPEPTGGKGRLNLLMNGSQTQHINSNGTDIYLLGMGQNAANVILSPNSNIILGYGFGASLGIANNSTLSTTGGSITTIHGAKFYVLGKIASSGTSISVSRNDFSGFGGDKLAFAPNSTVNNFTVNIDYNNIRDSVHISTDVEVTGVLSLTKGDIIMDPAATLHINSSTSVVPPGGSAISFIEGAVKRTGTTAFTFPVGVAALNKYAPVDFSNLTGNDEYTVNYHYEPFPVRTIDPVTLAASPLFGISGFEYWDITPTSPGGMVNLEFHYNDNTSYILDPGAVSIAHFDGTDWNNIGGLPDPSNTTDVGSVLVFNVNDFSPFTFAGSAGVVPLKLGNFDVKKQNKTVQLHWTTEQEINSKFFIIERSTDQNKWDVVTNVNAAGNSADRRNYSATDFNPSKGINYYRLKMIDVDGKFSYSEIRSVYFGSDSGIVIAPNPAKNKITVYIPGNDSFASISIYDMNARLVKTINTNEESVKIDLRGIAKGIYMLKINGKDIAEVKKLLIQSE